MNAMASTAGQFFDNCETGKGWDGCAPFCHPDATFSAQADALAEITTLEAYTEWMKGLMVLLPDGTATVRSFAVDEERTNVTVVGVFRGTHTGEGGPVPPTGRTAEADYVYVMSFVDGKIAHMTKVWNDTFTLRQLGWG